MQWVTEVMREKNHYARGKLFDDHCEIPVFTMEESNFENVAESTQLQFTQCSFTNTEVSVQCEEYNYHRSSESLLRLHMKDHRGKTSYPCDKCDFKTCSMDELVMHMNLNHREHESLTVTRLDDSTCYNITDFGQCNRSYAKRLKYMLYD